MKKKDVGGFIIMGTVTDEEARISVLIFFVLQISLQQKIP
jgi:hypothetical protein